MLIPFIGIVNGFFQNFGKFSCMAEKIGIKWDCTGQPIRHFGGEKDDG
jgi:hypothetical protein